MKLAALYIPPGELPLIFGVGHNELTINFGAANIYEVRNRAQVLNVSNSHYIDDILDPRISLFSCVVGGNGGGKTTLLRTLLYSGRCRYVIETSPGEFYLAKSLEAFHRVYYSPHLHHAVLDAVGINGKDLSKRALMSLDTPGNGGQLEDLMEAHYSENSKRWIRFNHFYRQLPVSNVTLPVFEQVELVLQNFRPNTTDRHGFNDTSTQLQPAILLLLEKIHNEEKAREIKLGEQKKLTEKRSDRLTWMLRFEYALYEAALGKFVAILEKKGNRYLKEGIIPDNYGAEMELLNVREAFEWFMRNAGVFRPGEQYRFDQHLSLLELIDYVRSLVNEQTMHDNWKKITISEEQALQVITLYDRFNHSFINDWFELDVKPLFGFLPKIVVSSGEQQFLDLFSVLYYHAQNITVGADIDVHSFESLEQVGEHLLLLLDEGDNAFHPQWKKEYVSNLRNMLPLIFPEFSIQVIITTHDPLTLSDLPKTNVIFLEKGPAGTVIGNSHLKRTFGGNVADLLKDSFFLQDGQIGSFAGSVIDRTIQEIRRVPLNNETISRIQRIIQALDEPVIKFKLAEMLSEAIGSRHFEQQLLENEIAWLQERRNQL